LLQTVKYAIETAERLGIKGWIKLDKRGKVSGHIQGEKDKVDQM
jgi:acylphosphatase